MRRHVPAASECRTRQWRSLELGRTKAHDAGARSFSALKPRHRGLRFFGAELAPEVDDRTRSVKPPRQGIHRTFMRCDREGVTNDAVLPGSEPGADGTEARGGRGR